MPYGVVCHRITVVLVLQPFLWGSVHGQIRMNTPYVVTHNVSVKMSGIQLDGEVGHPLCWVYSCLFF